MPLYTRTGDDGTTGLSGGGRTEKDSARMHAVGDVDELNAALGVVGDENLNPLQTLLFELGADLASPETNESPRVGKPDIEHIEEWIDQVEEGNDPLNTFILPGGCEFAARLHYARTVCRRAERSVTTLRREGGCSPETLTLLNRISDLLFAMARSVNKMAGLGDIPWTPNTDEE
ncbi:MAG: cob(I)yrinic acid a,c-diamide adenosyltransferase [Phycisphaerales bacterium]|jgi:cob(I)alamin adenosyltransferase|nr:cob(I)yrinic acid a,c-diamide adenosyltransferase [Phycisphaerales bacterium]